MGTSEIRVDKPLPRLHRLPLVPVAIALAGGIALGVYGNLPFGVWVAGALAALAVATASALRPHLLGVTNLALLAGSLAIGGAWGELQCFALPPDHIVHFTATHRTLATLRGQIVTSPQIIEDMGIGYRRPARTGFVLDAHSLTGDAGPLAVRGLVRVIIKEPARRLHAGDDVELVGWIGRYRGPDNPGEYDRQANARLDGVMVHCEVPTEDGARRLSGPTTTAERVFWHVRSAVRQHLEAQGDPEDGRLMNALLIGERHPALSSLNRTMMKAGIVHYLSISGSHLVIFLGFVYLVCRLVTLSPRASAIAALAVLVVYIVLAEPNAPLLRSAIMAAALCLATIAGRQYAALNALAGAAIIILAVDPMQLFSPGFQLSFGIVGGMVALHVPVRDLIFGRWLRRRGLMVFRGPRWWRLVRTRLVDGAVMGATAAITAWAVSTPLVAYHFGMFSPWAAPLSAVLSLPVTAVLIPGYLSMALEWPLPHLAAVLGEASAWAADALAAGVRAMEHLPALYLPVRPVGLWWVALCLAGLVVVGFWRRLPRAWIWLTAATVIVTAATAWTQRAAPNPAVAQVHVLAVGAGQCVVVQTPSGRTFIVDAGTRSGIEVCDFVLRPFLRVERLPCPREAFVSHANTDHFAAVEPLVTAGDVRRVSMNKYFDESQFPPPDSADAEMFRASRQFLGSLAARGVVPTRLRAGDVVQLDDRTRLEVLWPPDTPMQFRNADEVANETCLCLRLVCDGQSMLLTGDIGRAAQAALARDGSAARCDVLMMPHHGGWQKTLPDFVKACGAKYVIVSTDHDLIGPARDAPARPFYAELRRGQFYSTFRNGYCRVSLGGGRVEVTAMR